LIAVEVLRHHLGAEEMIGGFRCGLIDIITGNAGTNSLTGSGFADTLIGGGGLDTLAGGLGDDLYLITTSVDHSAAEIADAGGNDELRFASTTAGQTLTVFSGDVGLDSVTIGTGTAAAAVITATTALHVNANAAANGLRIKGNNGANTLIGSGFDDTLSGGAGNDTLIGGAGADTYRFDSTLNSTTNKDLLIDFSPSQNDRIELENAVFTGFATTGPLSATDFAVSAAATPSACILYNNSTGTLTYDSNGTLAGGTTVFAVLPSGLAASMTASLFTVT